MSLLNAGEFNRVAELGQKLTQSQPSAAVPWALLAAAQAGLGKLEDAAAHYHTALALDPNFIEARFNLGLLYFQNRDWPAAIECFERVQHLQPKHPQVRMRLANALHAANRLAEAANAYATAVSEIPNHAETRANYGSALMGLNRMAEALEHYDVAVRLDPEHPDYRVDRAQARLTAGQLQAAEQDLTSVLSQHPQHPKAHFRLSRLRKSTETDGQVEQLTSALAAEGLSQQDLTFLHFALAQCLEDRGALADAFPHFVAGNAAYKRLLGYSIKSDVTAFEDLKARQRADLLAPVEAAPAAPRPIFVIGLPRSGTSLVEQILASHSEVTGGGELSYFEDALDAGATPSEVRSHYLRNLKQLDPAASVITDKRPSNFKWIGLILQALPEARIVNVRRDPVAAGWSMFKHHFESPAAGFTNDLDDIATMIGLYEDLMAHFEQEFPGRVAEVNYEALTEQQEAETRKLLTACDLSWEDACLEFHKTARAVQTASATQVRQRMYQGSSQAWKRYAAQLADFRTAIGR